MCQSGGLQRHKSCCRQHCIQGRVVLCEIEASHDCGSRGPLDPGAVPIKRVVDIRVRLHAIKAGSTAASSCAVHAMGLWRDASTGQSTGWTLCGFKGHLDPATLPIPGPCSPSDCRLDCAEGRIVGGNMEAFCAVLCTWALDPEQKRSSTLMELCRDVFV